MKRGLILVEGQTEERFVQLVLNPHLLTCSVYLDPVVLKTSQSALGRGGVSRYAKIRDNLSRLLRDTSVHLVTTMIDYYGLPKDFPGRQSLTGTDPYQRVRHLEDAFAQDIQDPRFLPFLSLHEFEALLFADVEKVFEVIPEVTREARRALRQIAQQPPESIDDGESTHPSLRLLRYVPGYSKVLHGILIVQRIGLATIRQKCPHFNGWLQKLESS